MDVIFWQSPSGELVEMRPTPYDNEAVLQGLLEDHPHLLVAGRQEIRLLLVAREQGVPDDLGVPDRWSLDHLFVDSEAVPTLVEVKRATDTRIRREVVGQLLDYAANGVKYWPQGSLRQQFESTAGGPEAATNAFNRFQPEKDMTSFWDDVEDNLRAGRLRLVFVADRIPDTLRRIIEFLNEQMDRTEVLGVEVQLYAGGEQTSLVPRVLGRTTAAERIKPKSVGSYSEDVASGTAVIQEVAARLEAWAEEEHLKTHRTPRAEQYLEQDGTFLLQYYPMFGLIQIPVQRFIEAGRPDLHEKVRSAFQGLTDSPLSQKHLQVPALDLVARWPMFVETAAPLLRAASRQVVGSGQANGEE